MKLNHLILVADAIEKISEITDTPIPDITDALVSVCFDEETGSQIKQYHSDEGVE